MFENTNADAIRSQALIRIDTLIRLRWYAIAGQAGAIAIIQFGFGFSLPWEICSFLIIVSTLLNIILSQHYKTNHRLNSDGAFALLAFDLSQLGCLLYLTGGLENPFAILLMAPVVVSCTSLKRNHIILLGVLAITIISLLLFFHLPLPWEAKGSLDFPFLYVAGVWVAIICTLGFTAIYAFRVAEEARKLADALSATELILQREQHLTALDGLAAAAAHELGTPLATIALVSKEMVHAVPEDSALSEDAKLLRSQAERCREILQKLTSLSSAGEPIIEQHTLLALVQEVIDPLREFGIEIAITVAGDTKSLPVLKRNPGLHYGLGNLVDNAVDFARTKVVVVVAWDEEKINVSVSDDGPGFAHGVVAKLGEPFVTSRRKASRGKARGMGLGLFIAKTMLERTGAELVFDNKVKNSLHLTGAYVSICWQRSDVSLPAPIEVEAHGAEFAES